MCFNYLASKPSRRLPQRLCRGASHLSGLGHGAVVLHTAYSVPHGLHPRRTAFYVFSTQRRARLHQVLRMRPAARLGAGIGRRSARTQGAYRCSAPQISARRPYGRVQTAVRFILQSSAVPSCLKTYCLISSSSGNLSTILPPSMYFLSRGLASDPSGHLGGGSRQSAVTCRPPQS